MLFADSRPSPSNPFEQGFDGVAVDAVAPHHQADQRVLYQFGKRQIAGAASDIDVPAHFGGPEYGPIIRITGTYAKAARLAIAELAAGRGHTLHCAQSGRFPRLHGNRQQRSRLPRPRMASKRDGAL
jgi:hypothetical protein